MRSNDSDTVVSRVVLNAFQIANNVGQQNCKITVHSYGSFFAIISLLTHVRCVHGVIHWTPLDVLQAGQDIPTVRRFLKYGGAMVCHTIFKFLNFMFLFLVFSFFKLSNLKNYKRLFFAPCSRDCVPHPSSS
jgi:hypothetical protein